MIDVCSNCGGNDVDVLPAESDDEPDVLECYDCGHTEQLRARA